VTPFTLQRRRRQVAEKILETITDWQFEYLAEHERQQELAPRTLVEIGVAEVRAAAYVKPGELALNPAVIVWVAGATNHRSDPDSRVVIADIEVGVRIAVSAAEDEAALLLHHDQAAFSQLLMDFPTCGGLSGDLLPVDEDYSPFEQADESWRCGVDLMYVATGVEVGTRRAGPPPAAEPRPDPYVEPWPDAPTALTTDLSVTPVDPEDLP
jgi:hypothetical protein